MFFTEWYMCIFFENHQKVTKENLGQGIQKFQSNPTLLKPQLQVKI